MVQAERIEKERVLRQAFWSGKMSYRKWRGILRSGASSHRKIFLQAFRYLSMRWLLKEIGEDSFVKLWPMLRHGFDPESPREKAIRDAWDALWAMITVGDSQYPVDSVVATLSRCRREILSLVTCTPGITAYLITKKTGRSYSRVHKDIRMLIYNRMIGSRPMPGSVRRERVLTSKNSSNTELAEAAIKHQNEH